jgi:hypothetical protein
LPLSEKARIEVYLPDLPKQAYQDLLAELQQEFTYTFGGCTIVGDLDGSYLSRAGLQIEDRINLIFTDTPFTFAGHLESISQYMDEVRIAAGRALEEEAVLVAAYQVYHSE